MNDRTSHPIGAMLPHERRAVAAIALIAVFRMFGLFMLLPVLSPHALGLRHATAALTGLAVGAYGLSQALLQIPFGAISDRVGRTPVILFGLALFAAGSLIAAHSANIYMLIAGRFLQGAGAISSTLSALLADNTRETVRTRSMALLGIGIGASFMIALMFGPVIGALAGIPGMFYISAALAGVCALLLLLVPAGGQPVTPVREPLAKAFRPDLLRLDAYMFLTHGLLTASFVALPFLLGSRLGVTPVGQLKIYMAAFAVSLLGTVPLVLADERRGRRLTVGIAICLVCAGQLGLALFGATPGVVIAALAVFFAGFNFLEAGLPARLSVRAAGSLRGASLGVFSSSQFLGAFAGGLGGGWLLASSSPYPVFMVAAILAAAWLAWHQAVPPVE